MSRDALLLAVVIALVLFEWWGHNMDQRLEAWARGENDEGPAEARPSRPERAS